MSKVWLDMVSSHAQYSYAQHNISECFLADIENTQTYKVPCAGHLGSVTKVLTNQQNIYL